MLGYLRGPRAGAAFYNLGHICCCLGFSQSLRSWPVPTRRIVALIWFGHIGVDRLLGYGLKLPGGFQETHLGRIGRNR